MNPQSRFLFDENTGAPFVEALRRIVLLDKRHPVEIGHINALFGAGAKDPEWIPKVVEGAWIVISEDRGKNSSRGDKLPVLCLQHSVTHVLVMPSLLKNGGQFEKMRALMAVWPELLELPSKTRGARLRLKYASSSRSAFRLDPVVARSAPTIAGPNAVE